MFNPAFLFRLLQVAVSLVIAAAILYGFVWLINRGIQLLARHLGYEVGDFFEWLRSMLPKRKRKKVRKLKTKFE